MSLLLQPTLFHLAQPGWNIIQFNESENEPLAAAAAAPRHALVFHLAGQASRGLLRWGFLLLKPATGRRLGDAANNPSPCAAWPASAIGPWHFPCPLPRIRWLQTLAVLTGTTPVTSLVLILSSPSYCPLVRDPIIQALLLAPERSRDCLIMRRHFPALLMLLYFSLLSPLAPLFVTSSRNYQGNTTLVTQISQGLASLSLGYLHTSLLSLCSLSLP